MSERHKNILIQKGNPKSLYCFSETCMVCVMMVVFKACAHLKKTKALYNAYKFMLLMCFHSNRMKIWLAS